MSKVTITGHAYHRNGVGGDPFRVVSFTVTEDEIDTELIAILPSDLRDYNHQQGDVPCYVLNPNDPLESKWRGDRLYSDLLDAGLWERMDADDKAELDAVLAGWNRGAK